MADILEAACDETPRTFDPKAAADVPLRSFAQELRELCERAHRVGLPWTAKILARAVEGVDCEIDEVLQQIRKQ